MSEVKNIPRLRFPEFDENWFSSTVGKCFQIIGGGTPSTTNIEFWGGDVNWFTPTEIKKRTVSSSLRKISRKGLQNSSAKILPINTVLFTSRATIGEMSFATEECSTNQGFQSILPSIENDNRYFYYWAALNKKIFFRKSTGSTFLEISKKTLEKIQMSIPSLPEQQKIADFLTSVDKRIELLEKKKTLLETYKKGVMKKIFNQEIRFKDDNGSDFPDWEEKKLGGITNKKSSNISANSIESNEGNYTVYGATGELKEVDFFEMDTPYISIVKDGSGVGRVKLCKPYSSVLGTLDIITNNESSNLNFIYQFLSKTSFLRYVKGSSIPHIYYKDYSKLKLSVPLIYEQEKISKFLSSIDTQLELLETQIDKSKTWKKGLLQKMFV
jgi:type I restriction enzyme, S subunit